MVHVVYSPGSSQNGGKGDGVLFILCCCRFGGARGFALNRFRLAPALHCLGLGQHSLAALSRNLAHTRSISTLCTSSIFIPSQARLVFSHLCADLFPSGASATGKLSRHDSVFLPHSIRSEAFHLSACAWVQGPSIA